MLVTVIVSTVLLAMSAVLVDSTVSRSVFIVLDCGISEVLKLEELRVLEAIVIDILVVLELTVVLDVELMEVLVISWLCSIEVLVAAASYEVLGISKVLAVTDWLVVPSTSESTLR